MNASLVKGRIDESFVLNGVDKQQIIPSVVVEDGVGVVKVANWSPFKGLVLLMTHAT